MATAAHVADHGLNYPARERRATLGTSLLIVSDAAFVLAIIASQVYLRALNTAGQFHPHGESVPGFALGLVATLAAVMSAGAYGWGAARLRSGDREGLRAGVSLAFGLILVAFTAQAILLFSLDYPAPLHAYGSIVLMLTAYHAIHLLLTALIGFLLLGRIARRRIEGHEYVVQAAGYWWYYVAAAAVIVWAFLLLVG